MHSAGAGTAAKYTDHPGREEHVLQDDTPECTGTNLCHYAPSARLEESACGQRVAACDSRIAASRRQDWNVSLHLILGRDFRVPAPRVFDRAILRLEIDVAQPKALAESLRPLKVID